MVHRHSLLGERGPQSMGVSVDVAHGSQVVVWALECIDSVVVAHRFSCSMACGILVP